MIVYSGIPSRFIERFKVEIETWAITPSASPVMGFKTEFGEVDLIRHSWGRDIHIAPERENDIWVLDNFK